MVTSSCWAMWASTARECFSAAAISGTQSSTARAIRRVALYAPRRLLLSTWMIAPDHHIWVTPEYERYAADAAALGQIGRAIFPQPTRVRVRLPRALADLAVAAWARDEDDEDSASARKESSEQATARHRAGTLALIGLSIERARGGTPAGDDVLVDLEAGHIASAFDAAEEAGLLAGLRPPDPDEGP